MKILRAALLLAPLTLTSASFASYNEQDRSILHRDTALEENLKHAAAADQTITPGKVLRWMKSSVLGLSSTVEKETNLEFRPIVNVQETSTRFLATVAYKF
jgi:hypothetical protein